LSLRVIGINAADSRTIKAKFTDLLTSTLKPENVTVQGFDDSTPDAKVVSVSVSSDVLTITTLSQTPYARYVVTFKSTQTSPFTNKSGRQYLFEDNNANVFNIVAAENPSNEIRDGLVEGLLNQPYNPDRGTLIRDILNSISTDMLRCKYDIRTVKNENYLSFYVKDERKVRGYGPYDRLAEESAISVSRVGLTPENESFEGVFSYTSFPSTIISLQAEQVNKLLLSAGSGPNTFDKLTITVANFPVIKLTSLQIQYLNGQVYNYDIRSLGYQLQNSRYDSDFAGTLLTLENNQIQMSDKVLADPSFVIPQGGDKILISYEYKNRGRVVDPDSVEVYSINEIIRKPVPPIQKVFSLGFSPITLSDGSIPTLGGVQFLDPYSNNPFKTIHPAFLKELPFRYGAPPQNPGEYSVDYSTGTVYVYGSVSNNGTGTFPPAASFYYKFFFKENLDYSYWSDELELVASPLRDLAGQSAKISFNYEQVLIPEVDYKSTPHSESLNERIENRLVNANALKVLNSFVSNVFRIYNETTGELYKPTRFFDNTIYFSYQTPPNVLNTTAERVTFQNAFSETIIVNSDIVNALLTKVYKCKLLNNNIVGTTEDCIGSSFNSSVTFSKSTVFQQEIYFDSQNLTETENIDKLIVGQYQVDYLNGYLYVGVDGYQNENLGTISYKRGVIAPNNPHVLAVSDVYYSINLNRGVTYQLGYDSLGEGFIVPSVLERSDERYINGVLTDPITYDAGKIAVTRDIKYVRRLYDLFDLQNNVNPIDFSPNASWTQNIITLSNQGIQQTGFYTLDGSLSVTITTPSSGINLNTAISAVRLSDDQQLVDGYQTIVGNTLTFSVSSGALPGDVVNLIYTVTMNGAASPVVDYDKGEYYVDYTYLADEILVSYEFGDNVIDFRESSLPVGQEYYVSYRVGALRDALYENFATLINIPSIRSFDVDLNRERYRDALMGALQSFTKGPTLPSMTSLVSNVTKIDPKITEAAFQAWSLGNSFLYQNPFKDNGAVLVPGKFDQGILLENGANVTFDISSALRLAEGTLETWVQPKWNGLDNDAALTFSDIKKDGYALSLSNIFIGQAGINPDSLEFVVDKILAEGMPAQIYTVSSGLFIYFDSIANRFKILVKDIPDGYVYTGNVTSSGEFYNLEPLAGVLELDDVTRTSTNKLSFEFLLDGYDLLAPDGYVSGADGYVPGYSFDGIKFLSDNRHYIFDFGRTENTERFSLYKDAKGYLVFEVWDRGGGILGQKNRKNRYAISSDIQAWKAGEWHHVAIGWRLNTDDRRDEMHLFIDGVEVSNIIRYGNIPSIASTDRFRTIVPELVVGTVPFNAIAGNDLVTTLGSNIVTSSVDFSANGIVPGNLIQITEVGFVMYTILAVSGQSLTLSAAMPASLSNARFTVNPYSAVVETEIDVYKNIAVSVFDGVTETEIPGVRAAIPGYAITRNSLNQRVLKILGDAKAGDEVFIRTLGLNHRRCRENVYLYGDGYVLRTQLPPPINLDDVIIRSINLPYLVVGPSNSTLSLGHFIGSYTASQPSNQIEGRRLSIRVSGGNVDFSTATQITINGTSTGGPVEVLNFTAPGTLNTINKWQTITSIDVDTVPLNVLANGVGVEVTEMFSVTYADGNSLFPVIRFAYQVQSGTTLVADGTDIVTDPDGFFSTSDIGNLLQINAPVVGTYQILEIINATTVRLNASVGPFTGGVYGVFNVSISRSGFQNGFFYLEKAGFTNIGYQLPAGYYRFDYASYLEVPFNSTSNLVGFIGTDINGKNSANAVLDEFRILNTLLTDTRVGETVASNVDTVTTDFNAIRPFKKNRNTLVLLHFDKLPLENDVDFWVFAAKEYLQSATSVNENFDQSLLIKSKGLAFSNENRLNRDEGTIEFWVSPKYDTYNDPIVRFYFDASSSVSEEVISETKTTIILPNRASSVNSVLLDGKDYFVGGSLEEDQRTIVLKTALPYSRTPVLVNYVPTSFNGDRLSIYKNSVGRIVFNVRASGQDYQIEQPVFWPRDTWHRIRASYKFNTPDGSDEIRLFVDGEERGVIRFGKNIIFGTGIIFGQAANKVSNQYLVANMDFTDSINEFYIGQDYTGSFGAYARIDNLRLSDIAMQPNIVMGQFRDVVFNTDPNSVFPVIENAFTTFLLNFDTVVYKNEDFAIIREEGSGTFNFTIDIIDSFGIVKDNQRIKNILEEMIFTLKPAVSKATIRYVY
jgi:hypothetical protein